MDSDQLRDQLFDTGLLLETGVAGVYGRSKLFEDVVRGVDGLVSAYGTSAQPELLRFPPVMNRAHLERSGYLEGFPHLAGTVHSFCGTEDEHRGLLAKVERGEAWDTAQTMTEVVLTPAACYPVYPLVASRGAVEEGGATLDVQSYCFRHEPSSDPARMQMFRMREYVCIGTPQEVQRFRQKWLDLAQDMTDALGLNAQVEVANDPFFGRGGRMMALDQRHHELKFELLIPVGSVEQPTACISVNYHQDHFGRVWNLTDHCGEVAHSACVAFGLERLALALFRQHGLDAADWPANVRQVIELTC